MPPASLSFLLQHPHHSPGKPECVKPRARAEPGEPSGSNSGFLQVLPLAHGLFSLNDYRSGEGA